VKSDTKGQSDYYQTIARRFFKHRGAPFFLSPKDLELIARWEEARIPLGIILEGMDRSFENIRRAGKTVKVLNLTFCRSQVEKAFAGHRERAVGRKKKIAGRDEKRNRLAGEIERFLDRPPAGLAEVEEAFRAALGLLRAGQPDEDALEALDDDVGRALLSGCPEEEKERIRLEIRKESPARRKEDEERILEAHVVKFLREKHRIPFLSLYYY